MKGQIFLAGAVLFLVVLFFLASSIKFSEQYQASFLNKKIQNIEKEYIYITAISEKSNQSNFKELSEYFKDEVYGFNAFFIHITKTKDNYKVQIGNYFDSAVELKLDYYLDEKEDRINNKHTKTFVIDSSARKINITYSIDNEKNNKLFELGDDSITYIDFMIQEENMLRKKIVI